MWHRMGTVGQRSLPCLFLVSITLGSVGVASAGEDEPKPTLDNPTLAFSDATPLSPEELSKVLDRAIETQKQLDSLTAVFRLTCIENLEGMTPQNVQRKSLPYFAYNNGKMTGTLHWWRHGNLYRLDTQFDIPKDIMQQEYEDHVFTNDAEKHITYYCRTHQAIVERPGDFSYPSPADMLFPGYRGGFRKFKKDSYFQIRGFKGPKETYLIRVSIPSRRENSIDFVLSAKLDYAVTGWAGGVGRIGLGKITYKRDAQGRLIPQESILEVIQTDGKLERRRIMNTESITLGPPDPGQMEFKLPAMTLVTEHRTEVNHGKHRAYEVNEAGEWIEAPSN